jgi:cytochrome oxidase Cu insertion factor (SCO1/SenC/PrrC family)
MRIKLLLLISFFLSGYINGIGQNGNAESDRILAMQDSVWRLLIGKVFPIVSLKTIDGKGMNADNLIGKPTLINFWFTSCKLY